MTNNIYKDKILILDFGSQYTQLIARRVRELGVYCEIQPYDIESAAIKALNPKGIILSGGPETVTATTTPRVDDSVFTLGVPVLGICYGMQIMAEQLGGKVVKSSAREFGYAQITLVGHSILFTSLTTEQDVWMSHGDHVTVLPHGFSIIAKSNNTPIAAIANEQQKFYGVQFHPEVTHTINGNMMLMQFIHHICCCEHSWIAKNIIETSITDMQTKVGNDHVILGLSGGVDSAVVAALLHRAIGEQLTCIFVDTGLLRENEAHQVMQVFAEHLGVKVIYVDAAQRFLNRLQNITDPEEKRKIIGQEFIDVFEKQASQIKDAKWLAQGTIYPDIIESASSKGDKAKVIKSHHNVGGLPEKMQLKLLEPLRELFKDEVRQIGVVLGLAKEMVYRHPFPGTGLAVRILAEVKPKYISILRQADAIFIEELQRANLYDEVAQAFAVFLPVKSVGVVGDARQYEYVIALRAVQSVDFMTASWAQLPYDFLAHTSNRIANEISGVSRVVYDISSKPPATIEWE